jgi:hypothetical protein
MTAPRLTVREIELYEWPYRLRLPFRFGVITVTHGRQAVARARIRTEDGREAWGVAAEALAAKWFDKDLALSDAQNIEQLRKALEIARDGYLAAGADTAFGHYADHYPGQIKAGAALRLNPLVASYGPALIDRAVLDGLCRALGVSFYAAARDNLFGLTPHAIAPDLAGFDVAAMLRSLAPAQSIHFRHTVGLVDPIATAETRVDDGLPETLAEVVATYGHRYYKLKVGGDLKADLARLCEIAAVLDRMPEPYQATLDGNEQYGDAESVLALWRAMEAEPRLARLVGSIIFIEQPIKRQVALSAPVSALAAQKAVIIDESDGEVDAFPRAKALGYAGVSSKSCKGLYKSMLNLARCRLWNGQGGGRYFMSAEDLTTQAGTSVQQDLALVNLLGLTHVERNGHHFIDGFSGRPQAEARAYLAAHPDLYHLQGGQARIRIERGEVRIGSLDRPGFAVGADPDFAAMEPMPRANWPG